MIFIKIKLIDCWFLQTGLLFPRSQDLSVLLDLKCWLKPLLQYSVQNGGWIYV